MNWRVEPINIAVCEDNYRFKSLRRQSRKRPVGRQGCAEAKRMIGLASKIESNLGQNLGHFTLASARHARQWKMAVTKFISGLLVDTQPIDIAVFTTVPKSGWDVAGSFLPYVKAILFSERFRSQLNRAGLVGCGGLLIARLHGEFDPVCDRYQLHMHVLATEGAIDVVERLRELPRYRREKIRGYGLVKVPILRQKLVNPARQATYHLAQSS